MTKLTVLACVFMVCATFIAVHAIQIIGKHDAIMLQIDALHQLKGDESISRQPKI